MGDDEQTEDSPNAERLSAPLTVAMDRSFDSLQTARRLRAAGFNGPAYVWAVRSVEIFVREFALLPAFISSGLSFNQAYKKARSVLGGGNWVRAMARVVTEYGPIDPMLTTDDEDAWAVWGRQAPEVRGELVHGSAKGDASDAEVDSVIEWAEMLRQQLGIRLMLRPNHPAYAVIDAIARHEGWE
jgi:hypothetical protein